jgi:hypothetical protein
MLKILSIILIGVIILHGLIQVMGFVAYWPLAKISELPYRTTLLNGGLDLGSAGMRLFSLVWLFVGLGFLAAGILLALGRPSWAPVLLAVVLLSLVICILDWGVAFRGAIIDVVLLLILVVVFGLRIQPAPFPAYSKQAAPLETIEFPSGLPKPVERFYRQTYGNEIPVYHSAVISGRGTARFMGITFPTRLRFTHLSGAGYRHYFEITFYGLPIMRVNEHYLDGHTRLALPFGVVENDPGVDSAANQGLWGEMGAYPAVFVTDPRVRWEAIDDTTAHLYVPFGEKEQVFTVSFNPLTGAMTRMETLRYRDAKSGTLKWWGEIGQAKDHDGRLRPAQISVTWTDENSPWLVAGIEEMVFNTDVNEYIRQTGP